MHPYLKAEKILWELKFDFADFSMETFLRCVSRKKGREIIPIPWEMQMPSGLFGAWVSDSDEPIEYIFYRGDLSPIHKIHTQLHELSHFLCGHPTLHISQELLGQVAFEKASLRFADLPKLRSPNKAQIEAEAETLAHLIQERVVRHASLAQLTGDLSAEKSFADFVKTMRLT